MRSAPARLLRSLTVLPVLVVLLGPLAAGAGEFLSVAERAVVLYDAPSAKAKKLFVASQFYPVEVIVTVDNWVKVRDAAGDLAWVEKRQLSDRRTVLVKAGTVDVRQSADEAAPLAFQAREGVALELTEIGPAGWVRVRHRDGQAGFLRASAVWGL